jgi:hypothetical protein
MMRRGAIVCVVAALAVLVGCGADMMKKLNSDPVTQALVMNTVAGNPELAGKMVDHLLGVDSTRAIVIERVSANGDAMQGIMLDIARNQSRLDGTLNLAVQDSAMHEHVMTLFRGMQIEGSR